ncbi:uncharacterized protein LOC116949732 [Petromyzon marinus]|uniref:uncharacterized protein LOC116949732 n=1 Tax=Petromyzon marinus TaxID=7757 RepID=UPI003F6F1F94
MSWDCPLDPALVGTFPRPPIRLKISFEYAPPEAAGERLCWLALEPGRCRVVADLACLIRQRFGLGGRVGLSLFVQGCLLPPAEHVGLVRDGDTVHVRQTELLDLCPSSGESQSLPFCKKRKSCHGEGDSDGSGSVHNNVRKRKQRKKQETEFPTDQEDPQENHVTSITPAKKRKKKKAEEVNDDDTVNARKAFETSKVKAKLDKLKKGHGKAVSSSSEKDEHEDGSEHENSMTKVRRKNKVSRKSETRVQANDQKEKRKAFDSQQNGSALFTKERKRTSSKSAASTKSKVAVRVNKQKSDSSLSLSSGDDGDDGVQSDKSGSGSKAAKNKTVDAGRARQGKAKRKVTDGGTHATVQIPPQQRVPGKPVEETDSSSDSDENDKGNKRNSRADNAVRPHSAPKSAAAPSAVAKSSIAEKSSKGDGSAESDSSSSDDASSGKEAEPAVGPTPVNVSGRREGKNTQGGNSPYEVEDDAQGATSGLGRGQRKWNGAGNRGIGRSHGPFPGTPYPSRYEDGTSGAPNDEPLRGRGRGWRGSRGRGAVGESAAQSRSHLRFDEFSPEPEVLPSEELSRESGAGDTYTNASTVVQNAVEVVKRDYSALPTLDGPPRAGDHIAFKMLEMNENYSPEVSDYKEGEVLRFDPISRELEIMVKSDPSTGKRMGGKFELVYESDAEGNSPRAEDAPCLTQETRITIKWTSLIDPRLIVEIVPPPSVALPSSSPQL